MPINKFVSWAKGFMKPGEIKPDRGPAGPNPKPPFREVGKMPEDRSGFPGEFRGNKKPTFK